MIKRMATTKQNETHVTPVKDNTTSSANKKKTDEKDLHRLCLVNYGERTSASTLALDYPLLGPSRHVRTCYCMPSSSPEFLYSDQFCHETFCPLFPRLEPIPIVLDCSRLLVGVDTKSCEVVQEIPTPSTFSPAFIRSSRPLPVVRTLHTSAVSYPPFYSHLVSAPHPIFCEISTNL